MTLKSDAKFEEKLTLDSKNDVRNLGNSLTQPHKSPKISFRWAVLVQST